jgi:hypothetical protein
VILRRAPCKDRTSFGPTPDLESLESGPSAAFGLRPSPLLGPLQDRGRPAALAIALLAAAALLLGAPPALAAVRYATPGGAGAEPCNPVPCNLPKAVNGASDGDEVVVGPGTYKPGVEVEVDRAISVGGTPGAPPPLIQISNHFLRLENAAALVHDLRVEVVAPTLPYAINDEAGTVERVYAYSMESAGACEIASGTLRDSVCWGGLEADAFTGGTVQITLRNVTATTTTLGASGSTHAVIDGANLIMHSIDPGDAKGADLAIDVGSGASATISLTHSDYASVDNLSSGTDFTFTPPGAAGNQTAPPQFADAASGDLHELPSSPTVDAGLADPLIGATDLDGASRSQPACLGGSAVPDIGAYELAPTTACPQPAASPSPPPGAKASNRFGFGNLKRNARKGTASLAVQLPGPGSVTLSGKGLVRQHAAALAAGRVELAVRARGGARKRLAARGQLAVSAVVSFTPTGGDAATATRRLKLLRRR